MVVSQYEEAGRSNSIRFLVQKNNDVWEEVNTYDDDTLESEFGREVALSGETALIASDRNVYLVKGYFPS